jgi:hypothetical protein
MQLAFYLQLLLILGAATALACWCGWGLAQLTLSEALWPYRGLLTPLLGFALAIVTGYWFVRTVSGLPLALAALLTTTGGLNILAWRRNGPPRLISGVRQHLPLLLLLIATLLVGIAPLLHYGHPAVIGGGWDIETALPTARYIERGPISAIASAAPNPLRDLVRDPPRIGKTLGFAVWQGSLSELTGIEAIVTFAPLLAWLRSLGVLAAYVLFRATLGLRRGPALLGAAWTSAGALMLWISYFNFEKQMASWALIPLALLLGVAAVEDFAARGWRAWPMVLTAAIGLTALPVAYYPALTLWVPLALGLAAAILIQASNRLRLLGGALALVAVTILLAAPTIIDYSHGFAFRYSEQLTSLGVLRYIPMTDILGLTPYLHGQRNTAPTPPWSLAGLGALAGLAAAGLILPTKDQRPMTDDKRALDWSLVGGHSSHMRLRWLGMAAGVLAYLGWLRWWQQYPYAYLKGAAYAGFVFMGLAAAGWQAIATRLAPQVRLAAAAVPLLVFVPMIASQARIVAIHWPAPGLYPNDFPALLELRERIPAGSTVTLTDNLHTEGVISGLAAYMLDHTTVWGHVKTGYTSATTGPPDAIGEYALLPESEDPTSWGYQKPIWSGGSYALYQRPPGVLAHVRPEALLRPGASLTLAVGGERLALGRAALPAGPTRRLDLLLATLQGATISLDGKTFAVPAGSAQVHLAALPTGRALEIRNTGANPLLLRSITLADVDENGTDAVEPLRTALVTSARAAAAAQTVTTTLQTLLPNGGPLTLALDIWDNRRSLHYGWYGVTLEANPQIQTIAVSLDLRSGQAQAHTSDGAALPFGAQFEGLREGDYSARLQVSAGTVALAPPSKVFSFRVGRDGAVSAIQTEASPLLMTTTDRPPHPLDARVGDDVLLHGYAIDRTSARAGDTLTLTLWWESSAAALDERAVLIHLINRSRAIATQADGPPAHGSRPTTQWRAGDIVIDSHQIALPADLPPGEYTLVFGMYRWPSLERLALRIGDKRQDEDIVRVPITVTH